MEKSSKNMDELYIYFRIKYIKYRHDCKTTIKMCINFFFLQKKKIHNITDADAIIQFLLPYTLLH